MQTADTIIVMGKGGWRGTLVQTDQPQGGETPRDLISLEDGRRVWAPTALLERQEDGTYYLPLDVAELEQPTTDVGDATTVIPIIEETLDVRKRVIETGVVRIRKIVQEREEVVDEPLLREEVGVERIPINQIVAETTPARYEGETMIVPLFEEVLVVEKRLMLKEELRITKRQTETHAPQTVRLRSEEATIERISAGGEAEQTNLAAQSS